MGRGRWRKDLRWSTKLPLPRRMERNGQGSLEPRRGRVGQASGATHALMHQQDPPSTVCGYQPQVRTYLLYFLLCPGPQAWLGVGVMRWELASCGRDRRCVRRVIQRPEALTHRLAHCALSVRVCVSMCFAMGVPPSPSPSSVPRGVYARELDPLPLTAQAQQPRGLSRHPRYGTYTFSDSISTAQFPVASYAVMCDPPCRFHGLQRMQSRALTMIPKGGLVSCAGPRFN